MSSEAKNDVLLEYEVSLSPLELVVEYAVTNAQANSIWLTTPLTRVNAEGQMVADPKRAYVYVDPEGVLHVTKRFWPVPADLDVYWPERPLLTEVRAGGVFKETVRFAVPVRVDVPYAWARPRPGPLAREELVVNSLRFSFSIEMLASPKDARPKRLRGEEVELVVAVVDGGE